MVGGFSLGRALARLVYGNKDSGSPRDAEVFDAAIKHTLGWYVVVGSVAVVVTPLLYTTVRVIAVKRKAFILQTASTLVHPSAEVNAAGKTVSRAFFLTSVRTSVAARRILDARRTTDNEFAIVFANEVLRLYIDSAVRVVLRLCFRDCLFHVGVFVFCAMLGRFNPLLVAGAGAAATGADAGDSATPFGTLLRVARQAWWDICHGALLLYTVEGVTSPYAYFIFSQSSPRMLERWFPWFGKIHFAVARWVDPSVYLDSRWRTPDAADRVWRAMTPKGFAAMWCCRCVMPLLCPTYYKESGRIVVYSSEGGSASQVVVVDMCKKPCNGVKVESKETSRIPRLLPIFQYMCWLVVRTGKTSMMIFALTSFASAANFSWLPFPCTGGPQYVALCYAEMVSMMWWVSFLVIRSSVGRSLRRGQAHNPLQPIPGNGIKVNA
ncbi:hypothetical protein DQ04_02241070 [Trypanosoma grayi]|uniref:hypothetical protein n=1 Tax=Trypanosoma grayi TaxID=71804 RepID=UPI0004F444F8|nr:hypothetical protein DQ04_02241070 [Trypanosoma grayi]KEG11829.1 hypothetical protein DQ04_02241070 [Trypanosoma grayi]